VTGAVDARPAAESERVEFVTFRVAGTQYALEVGRVTQVTDSPPTTRVPHTPSTVRGVASVAGEVTVVVDARAVLGIAGGTDGRLLVLDRGDRPQAVALAVDAVDGIDSYAVERIARPDPDDPDVVQAVVDRDGGPLQVLAVERIAATAGRTASTEDRDGDGDN